jgi:hypothetical protein
MRRHKRARGTPVLPLAACVVAAAVVGFAASSAYTASNTVPTTNISQSSRGIGPNDLKPPGCASLTLNHLVLGSTGSGSGFDDDLVLGTSGVDNMTESGSGGGSCLIGGLGSDNITAVHFSNDICIANATAKLKFCATTITSP